MTLERLTERARSMLADARAAEAAVSTAVHKLRELCLLVFHATTGPEAVRWGFALEAAREMRDDALDRLSALEPRVDAVEAEVSRVVGERPAPDARILVSTIRSITGTTATRAADWDHTARLATERVQYFSECDSLCLRVSLELYDADLEAADRGLERLRALEFDLGSAEVSAAVRDLAQRRALLDQ